METEAAHVVTAKIQPSSIEHAIIAEFTDIVFQSAEKGTRTKRTRNCPKTQKSQQLILTKKTSITVSTQEQTKPIRKRTTISV